MYGFIADTRHLMKKFLVYCLVAIMLVASVSVVASAAASDWTKGNGFHVYRPADETQPKSAANMSAETRIETNSPVTTQDAAGEFGVKVAHKGYFETGDNWGGVVSNERFGLDGLEITVAFEQVPEVDSSDDCWIALDLVNEPRSFTTGANFNPGFIQLVRFGRPEVEVYGSTGWAYLGASGINGSDFAVKSGDTLKLNVRYENAQYIITVSHNDAVSFEVPTEFTYPLSDEIFLDGTAHALVMASCFGVDKNFKYTVNVKPGNPLTEEQIAAKAFEKAKVANIATVEASVKDITDILEDALEEAGDSTIEEVTSNVAVIEAALETATAQLELANAATNEEESNAARDAAVAAKVKADEALSALETYMEFFGDSAPVEPTPDETGDAATEETPDAADNQENNDNDRDYDWVWSLIAAVVVVVVAVVVVVVLGKKKKN